MGSPAGDLAQTLLKLTRLGRDERAELLRGHGSVDEVVIALTEEAERLVMGDLQQALEATEALQEVADAESGPGARARARRARAQALTYANRFEEALTSLRESVELADLARDELTAARARLTMVHALARLGRYDEAIAAGESARDGFCRNGDEQWAAKAEVNLGVTLRMRNDPTGALEHFDRAREVLAGDPMSRAALESNRADALLELNQFAAAEAAFISARDAFEQAGARRAAAIVEGNLADVLSRQGRLQGALYHFERARRHLEADGAAGDLARLEAEQADAFAGTGLLAEAAEGYAAALAALDEHGLALEAARARAGLGRALTLLGRFEEAAAMLQQSGRGYRQLGNAVGTAHVTLLTGELALAAGQPGRATTQLASALEQLTDRPAEAAAARRSLAAAAIARNDVDEAERLIAEALDAAREYNLAPLLADLLHLRADLRNRQGRPNEALSDLRSAVAEVDRIRGTLQADRLRAAYAGSRSRVYEDLIRSLLDIHTDSGWDEAFGVVEQARSRSLLDLVAGAVETVSTQASAATDDRSATLLDQVLRIRGELNALYFRLPRDDRDASRLWRRQVEDRERALQTLEDRVAATGGLEGLFAAPIDAGRTRALLDHDTALVEYFIAGDELIAFVVRPDELRCIRGLAGAAELQELVELTRFQLERPLAYGRDAANTILIQDVQRELRNLHRILLAPLMDAIGPARRLVVVPHGVLHGVPFHALYDGHRYLVEDREILYTPSASLLSHLPSMPAGPGGRGSVIFGVADETAPRIEQEVQAAVAHLPGARLYTGAQATWQRLQDESSSADVLHLACHGWFSAGRPLASGVKLADRWMTVRDVYGLHLDGAVVVLSGCETGRSAISGADEQVGLVRGSFAAGASALLMTLWPVHDETAGILMAYVYEFWQNGGPDRRIGLAAALRAAQRRLMKENPHPIFWAPFILVGRP